MSSNRRSRRRPAWAGGSEACESWQVCPGCDERPVAHVVPTPWDGFQLVACVECWPDLEAQLEATGLRVSGCMGPCCQGQP